MVNWKPGMEAVCIKRGPWIDRQGKKLKQNEEPEYNKVYKVVGVGISRTIGGLYLTLEGFPSKRRYLAARFRPVEKKKTSVGFEILEKIRDGKLNVLEEERA